MIRHNKTVAAIVMIFFVSLGSFASAQNVLVDSGFEGTITYDGPPFQGSWEGFSSGDPAVNPLSAFTTVMPRTGAQSLDLLIDNVTNGFAGVFQEVPAVGGAPVEFSVWHKDTGGSNGAGIEMRLEWVDAMGAVTPTGNSTPASLGTQWEQFTVTDIVPAGMVAVRGVYAIQSFGGPANQQIYVDDAFLSVVPEPASFAMIGLGLAGLALARRRQK